MNSAKVLFVFVLQCIQRERVHNQKRSLFFYEICESFFFLFYNVYKNEIFTIEEEDGCEAH